MEKDNYLPEITPKELKDLLCLLEKMDNPPALMVYGPPGVGKTSIIKEFAEDPSRDYELRVKHLSRMDPADLSGLPKVSKDNIYAEFMPISLFKPTQKKRLVIFFDELNTAMPQVLNAALDIILEKKADSETFSKAADLGEKTIILAAGNLGPEEDGTQTEELSMAVKTRMVQVRLKTDIGQWRKWAEEKKLHPSVIGYLDSEEKLIDYKALKNMEKQAPTPRGWEKLSQMIEIIESMDLSKEEKNRMAEIISLGAVGAKRGGEFFRYYAGIFLSGKSDFNRALGALESFIKSAGPADAPAMAENLSILERGLENGFKLNEKEINILVKILSFPKGYLTCFKGLKADEIIKTLEKAGEKEASKKLYEAVTG